MEDNISLQIKFARKSDSTSKGMNEGYVFNDGQYYCENEILAKAYVESLGLNWEEEIKSINTTNEWFYYTDWSEILEEQDFWYNSEGILIEKIN